MIRFRKVPITLWRANPPAKLGHLAAQRELYRRRNNAGKVCSRMLQIAARANLWPMLYSETESVIRGGISRRGGGAEEGTRVWGLKPTLFHLIEGIFPKKLHPPEAAEIPWERMESDSKSSRSGSGRRCEVRESMGDTRS